MALRLNLAYLECYLTVSLFHNLVQAAGMKQYKHLLEEAAKYSKGDLALAMVRRPRIFL
jgi:hypothetical protein